MVFSPRWYTILGYKPYQFPQSYASWWRLVHPDDADTLERTIKEHISGSECFSAETRMMTGSGQWCWVLIRGRVIEKDRDGRPVRMLGTLSDIAEHRLADDALKASLSEKEAFLKEIHHRVKNNLQVIVSMLNIQSRRTTEDGARRALADCQNRVKSMAFVHENLCRSDDLANVNFGDYVKSLASFLLGSHGQEAQGISLKISMDDVFLQIDQAIPCGLVINELVTNCIKHAFPAGVGGEIQIEGHIDEDTAVLTVRDNGIGLPADISSGSNESLGFKLIDTLVKQLKGTMDVDTSCGTKFTITFSTGSARMDGFSGQATSAGPGKLPPGI
jgi:PAS domain S-box-containing protein